MAQYASRAMTRDDLRGIVILMIRLREGLPGPARVHRPDLRAAGWMAADRVATTIAARGSMDEKRADDSAIALVAELEDALRLTRMYLQAKGGYARAADAEYVEAVLARASAWRRGALVPPPQPRAAGVPPVAAPDVAPTGPAAEGPPPGAALPTREL